MVLFSSADKLREPPLSVQCRWLPQSDKPPPRTWVSAHRDLLHDKGATVSYDQLTGEHVAQLPQERNRREP